MSAADTETLPDLEHVQKTRQGYARPGRCCCTATTISSMDHVIRALTESVPGMPAHRAVRIMLEAHLRQLSIVTVCPLETAEYYRDRLISFSLTSTVEPADK